jgi:two-component system phosphate regulon sensor histidine kinase PhoR
VARQKSISLRENLTNQPLAVLADKADLQRAIGNLVDNAIHYTPAGGVIHVETHRDERHASVIIRDNGIGIPDDDLANIFERFYRAANGRATDPGGTGLGLAIVKKVIESHHGNIEVSSRVGEGTTFVIRLPLMTNGAQHSSRES